MSNSKFNKYLKIAKSKIVNHFQTEVYLRTGKFLPKPMKVYYLISNKCNYKCTICPQWECGLKEDPKEYINTQKMKELINEMKELKIGEFGISGGEALIYTDKTFELLEYANKKGLYTHFVSNGSLITKEILDKYEEIGGGHISLSIDAIGLQHDKLRGVNGAYESIENILKLFKENNYKKIVLKINTVLSGGNLEHIMPVIKLTKESGALIFVQPYDAYDYKPKLKLAEKQNKFPLWIQENQFSKLEQVLDDMLEFKKQNPEILLNDKRHIKSMYKYFKECQSGLKCFAGIDQVAISPQGKITFCKYGEFYDLKKNGLKDYIKSKKRKEIIEDSLNCKQGCLLSCMFRPSIGSMILNGPKQFLKLVRNK